MIIQSFFIMNLKNRTTFTLLVSLLIFLLSYGLWKNNELDNYKKRINTIEGELRESEYDRIACLKLYSPVYTDYFNNKMSIQEKTGIVSSVLIYRFAKDMCAVCVHEDLYEIEQFQQEVGKDKIVLLPTYPDGRMGMIELTNMLATKFNYLNVPFDTLLIPHLEDNYLRRYFAVIDRDGNLTMVFFPHKDETHLTRLYFSEVKKIIID